MTEAWRRILDNDFAIPPGVRPLDLLDDLLGGLAVADPTLRDGMVYPVFATWVERGHFDDSAELVGDRVSALFTHSEVQARTFAALILAELITRDSSQRIVSAETAQRWFDAFAAWWLSETDVRGYDDTRGWLHAIAHGADAVGAFSANRHSDRTRLLLLMDLTIERVLTAQQVWDAMEDQRLALALTTTLMCTQLSDSDVDSWLRAIGEAFSREADIDPIRAWRQNLLRLLNALYVHLSRTRTNAHSVSRWNAVEPTLAAAIRAAWPPVG